MRTVFVGLSGGVDSSVAAKLLQEQGYDVVGVYMKNWSRDVASHHCSWKEDLASARSVAAHLQIPFKVYDFEKEYFEEVTKYMLGSYKRGITPNPDIICNQKIKFNTFFKKCLIDGADYVATGHYARLDQDRVSKEDSRPGLEKVMVRLIMAKDEKKDQTYFLYRMDPKIAEKVLFPIGNYEKAEVRKLAKKFSLPTADRPDSQGLCFVGSVPMRDFLGEFIKPKKGDIVDEQGKKIGNHNGAFTYTIGQRQGLGVGGGKPYYVYGIDTQENIVHVTTNKSSPLLNKTKFTISDCVWWKELEARGSKFEVRVRYRSRPIPCEILPVLSTDVEKSEKRSPDFARDDKVPWRVTLKKPEFAIAPGQSAVFYDGEVVVGGGVIQ